MSLPVSRHHGGRISLPTPHRRAVTRRLGGTAIVVVLALVLGGP